MHDHGRHGAKMQRAFNPAQAARLDDPARFAYLPVADVLALLDPPSRATVVDFGTGTGTYALEIAHARPDLRVVALDEQPEMLGFLRAKLTTEASGNVEPVGPEAQSELHGGADRVLALNVLHELSDTALADVRALLASGGSAVVIDWSGEVERPVGPPPDVVYTPAEARERLSRNGFRITAEKRFPYHYALVAQKA